MRVSTLVESVRLIEFSIACTFDCCSSDVSDLLSPSLALLLLLLLLTTSVRMEIVHDSSSSDNIVSIPSTDLFCTKHNDNIQHTIWYLCDYIVAYMQSVIKQRSGLKTGINPILTKCLISVFLTAHRWNALFIRLLTAGETTQLSRAWRSWLWLWMF